jgi:diphthine synthase
MIYFIGLGIANIKDISLRGLEIAKSCDEIYLESYTNFFESDISEIEKILEKNIKILKREDLEKNFDRILEIAKNKKIAILFFGDPFFATTHISLKLEAIKRNIEVETVHSSSIFPSVCEIGLSCYKFGKIVSIPLDSKYKDLPYSVYKSIKENKERGLHTLCLLDIDIERNEFLSPNVALKKLVEAEKIYRENAINENEEIVVICRLGHKNQKIFFEKISKLLNFDFGNPPFSLIIPSSLSSIEKECLSFFRGKENNK